MLTKGTEELESKEKGVEETASFCLGLRKSGQEDTNSPVCSSQENQCCDEMKIEYIYSRLILHLTFCLKRGKGTEEMLSLNLKTVFFFESLGVYSKRPFSLGCQIKILCHMLKSILQTETLKLPFLRRVTGGFTLTTNTPMYQTPKM